MINAKKSEGCATTKKKRKVRQQPKKKRGRAGHRPKKKDQLQPQFEKKDLSFVHDTSAEMFNLLLNVTTGEANSVVRRKKKRGCATTWLGSV